MIEQTRQYAAFLSYAHQDEAIALRVQKALETYAIPRAISRNAKGKLSPIFRDVTELTAHHSLSEKIKNAVIHSKYLIVLCSPTAKMSQWVNEEIRLFREIQGENSILCVLIDGTPGTSFPPALLEGNREPLAANMTGAKEGFKFGITQLAASMLGVGLDDLMQREVRRRRTRNWIISGVSIAFSTLMGLMTWTALDARQEAETSRTEAEKMVEYMLTDIKEDLDEVGRLDIVSKVGRRAKGYYDAIPLSDMDDDRLARQARTRQLLGSVALSQGNYDEALDEFSKAYKVTSELILRRPKADFALLSHSESELGLINVYTYREQADLALPYGLSKLKNANFLYESDPSNKKYALDYALTFNTLGRLYYTLQKYADAEKYFSSAINTLESATQYFPDDTDVFNEIVANNSNLAVVYLKQQKIEEARLKLAAQIKILKAKKLKEPGQNEYWHQILIAQTWLQNINVTKLNICNQSEINELISGLENIISYDDSNQSRKEDYIAAIYDILNHCSDDFTVKWQRQKLDTAMVYERSFQEHGKNLKKMVIWLENFQAR